MARSPWGAIDVHVEGRVLTGRERLAALVRWLRGEPPAGSTFHDVAGGAMLTAPTQVNWNQFPLQEAMAAVDEQSGSKAQQVSSGTDAPRSNVA
jgi:hypothetical protein